MRTRELTEREIGAVTDAEYKKALPLARRKQKDLHRRFGGCQGRQYLALLTGEIIAGERMAQACETMHHALSGKGKGSINDYHIESASVIHDTTTARICQEQEGENHVQYLSANPVRARLSERA